MDEAAFKERKKKLRVIVHETAKNMAAKYVPVEKGQHQRVEEVQN